MSRIISHHQYAQLEAMRKRITDDVARGNNVGMYHGIGQVQGYLLGLHITGEIDEGDMAALETETFANLDFLLNARKAANAH